MPLVTELVMCHFAERVNLILVTHSAFFSARFISIQMYLKHNSLGDDIPIVIILKAMGLECDQEIVQLVGTEPEMLDMFAGSLEEPYNLGIFSQDQVYAWCFYAVYFVVLTAS